MEATEKSGNAFFKKLGLGGIAFCAILCSLPIIAGALGLGGLIALAAYFEKIGLLVFILSLVSLAYWLYKRRRAAASSCGIDCACKTESP